MEYKIRRAGNGKGGDEVSKAYIVKVNGIALHETDTLDKAVKLLDMEYDRIEERGHDIGLYDVSLIIKNVEERRKEHE